jgi:hypothetical protein
MNLRVTATLAAALVITLAVSPGHADLILHLAADHDAHHAVDRLWHGIRHLARTARNTAASF